MIANGQSSAKALGVSRYFTGRLCKYGHLAERYTVDGHCSGCQERRDAERVAKHGWRLRNEAGYREKHNAKMAENWRRRVKNFAAAEKHRQKVRDWREANLERAREMARRSAAKQRAEHSEKTNAHARKAQTARLKRFPKWVDEKKIQAIYASAKVMSEILGEEWHVDHVVPLQGKRVSGLHVHENLQILPRVENMRKHNHFEVI